MWQINTFIHFLPLFTKAVLAFAEIKNEKKFKKVQQAYRDINLAPTQQIMRGGSEILPSPFGDVVLVFVKASPKKKPNLL